MDALVFFARQALFSPGTVKQALLKNQTRLSCFWMQYKRHRQIAKEGIRK
jgi:hypothetical protein